MANQDALWEFELNADMELELTPTYAHSERREFRTSFALETWNVEGGSLGMTTGATAAFYLSNGAIRSPDAAWTANARVSPPRREPPKTCRSVPILS